VSLVAEIGETIGRYTVLVEQARTVHPCSFDYLDIAWAKTCHD
jgi:hypothetical protein